MLSYIVSFGVKILDWNITLDRSVGMDMVVALLQVGLPESLYVLMSVMHDTDTVVTVCRSEVSTYGVVGA